MTSHAHNLPSDGISCRICSDSGLYRYNNEWRVCQAPHTAGKRDELQRRS